MEKSFLLLQEDTGIADRRQECVGGQARSATGVIAFRSAKLTFPVKQLAGPHWAQLGPPSSQSRCVRRPAGGDQWPSRVFCLAMNATTRVEIARSRQ